MVQFIDINVQNVRQRTLTLCNLKCSKVKSARHHNVCLPSQLHSTAFTDRHLKVPTTLGALPRRERRDAIICVILLPVRAEDRVRRSSHRVFIYPNPRGKVTAKKMELLPIASSRENNAFHAFAVLQTILVNTQQFRWIYDVIFQNASRDNVLFKSYYQFSAGRIVPDGCYMVTLQAPEGVDQFLNLLVFP